MAIFVLAVEPPIAFADCKLLQIAEFHADVSRGVPIIDGSINGHPIKILIDSGAETSMVMRSSAEKLGLASSMVRGSRMYGVGGYTQIYSVLVKQLKVDKFVTANLNLLEAGDDRAVDGFDLILGYDFLSRAEIEFDLADGLIRLFQPQGCQPAQLVYWNKPYSQADLLASNPNAPALETQVLLNGRRLVATIDSGASESTVDIQIAGSVGVSRSSAGVKKAGFVSGLGPARREDLVGNFDSFTFGDETIGHPHFHLTTMLDDFKDTSIGSHIATPIGDAPLMLIGADFLRAHRVFVATREHLVLFSYTGGPVFLSAEDLAVLESDHAISLDPNDAAAYLKRGEAHWRRGQLDLALHDLDQAVRLSPSNEHAFISRAGAHAARGEFDLADQDFKEAIRLKPDEPDIYVGRRSMREDRHEFDLALQDDDRLVQLKPADADALNGRCWGRALANVELNGALADCDAAIAQQPSNAQYLDSRALVYFRLAQYDKAIVDDNRALRAEPKLASSRYIRGLAERRLGDTASGAADMAAAKVIDPKISDTYAQAGVSP